MRRLLTLASTCALIALGAAPPAAAADEPPDEDSGVVASVDIGYVFMTGPQVILGDVSADTPSFEISFGYRLDGIQLGVAAGHIGSGTFFQSVARKPGPVGGQSYVGGQVRWGFISGDWGSVYTGICLAFMAFDHSLATRGHLADDADHDGVDQIDSFTGGFGLMTELGIGVNVTDDLKIVAGIRNGVGITSIKVVDTEVPYLLVSLAAFAGVQVDL